MVEVICDRYVVITRRAHLEKISKIHKISIINTFEFVVKITLDVYIILRRQLVILYTRCRGQLILISPQLMVYMVFRNVLRRGHTSQELIIALVLSDQLDRSKCSFCEDISTHGPIVSKANTL